MRTLTLLFVCLCGVLQAQDPIGTLEGQVADPSSAVVSGAQVAVQNLQTGLRQTGVTSRQGTFRFANLPVGDYSLTVAAPNFAPFSASPIRIDVGRIVNYPVQLEIASSSTKVDVQAQTATIDTSTALGNVVSEREATDLPLNGRDLMQLGLLQPGVAPVTAGLAEAGGILRSGQAFAVNGQRPESNDYLLDGVTNVDSVNGGFAIRTPVDAVSEFRILSLDAPPEYGETSGATTTVVTKSGGNSFHGDVYDFLRNNAFDSRNFFASTTEPLHLNQFGATLGGPLRRNKDFFFVYFEGQRDNQGESQAAIVPTAAERTGNFSGLVDPSTGLPVPLINEFTGQPFPGNQIPSVMLSPIGLAAAKLFPLPNGPQNVYQTTQMETDNYNQGGFRYDHYFGNNDQIFARYAASAANTLDPLPINGSNVPGFPVADSITTNSFTISDVHIISPQTVQTVRLAFFRNSFIYEDAQNHTPGSTLGFAYQPTLGTNAGIPFLIVSGYADVGNPITGPQNTYQNDYQGSYSIAMTRGRHNLKLGAEVDRQQIDVLLGIATNGFFVFAPFPCQRFLCEYVAGDLRAILPGRRRFQPRPA